MSPISTQICVPNLVAVRWSCLKKRGGYTQTGRQRETAALYNRLFYIYLRWNFVKNYVVCIFVMMICMVPYDPVKAFHYEVGE